MSRDLVDSDPSFRVACLRSFNAAGAHESTSIGESPRGKPNNLIPFVAQVAAGQHKVVKVFGDDYPTNNGTGIRDYIHVVDLAEGHLAGLHYLFAQSGYHIMSLVVGKGYSVLDVIKAFQAAAGKAYLLKFALDAPPTLQNFTQILPKLRRRSNGQQREV